MFHSKRGQSLPEYAMMLAVVAVALIAMQVYVKRGMQGRLRDLGNQISATQYEDPDTSGSTRTNRTSRMSETDMHGIVSRSFSESSSSSGSERVAE